MFDNSFTASMAIFIIGEQSLNNPWPLIIGIYIKDLHTVIGIIQCHIVTMHAFFSKARTKLTCKVPNAKRFNTLIAVKNAYIIIKKALVKC